MANIFKKKDNLFDMHFQHNPELKWSKKEDDLIELVVENTGFFNHLAQRFFKRPKYSHIALDEFGSTVWLALESNSDILTISEILEAKFGERAHPLLPRLGRFFQIMLDNKLIIQKQ